MNYPATSCKVSQLHHPPPCTSRQTPVQGKLAPPVTPRQARGDPELCRMGQGRGNCRDHPGASSEEILFNYFDAAIRFAKYSNKLTICWT
jgi:hypothetical protein